MESSYPSPADAGSPEDRLRLAKGIADPTQRAQYIDEANQACGWASIEEAAHSGRSYMVKAREDILVLDHDDDDLLVESFIEEYCSDFDWVICWSGMNQHQHGYIVVDDPAEREGLAKSAKDFRIADVQYGRWIRPPLAPHRLGKTCSTLKDINVEEAADRLHRAPRSLGLGRKATNALLRPAPETKDGTKRDRSHELWSATVGMVNQGYDPDLMWRLLLDHPGGDSLRARMDERGWSEAKTRMWWERHVLPAARERVRLRPTVKDPAEALRIIYGARGWMEARRWKGTGGAHRKAVLIVLLDLAEELRRVHDLGISVREIAERAGMGHAATATRNLKRLKEIGIIQFVPRGERYEGEHQGPTANRYTITLPEDMTPTEKEAWERGMEAAPTAVVQQSESGGVSLNVAVPTLLSHDAFRPGSLSKNKFHVWEWLSFDTPLTTKQIASQLQYKKPDGVRGHLKALEMMGLAIKTDNGWLRLQGDLDAIAEFNGTVGKGERQCLRHAQERHENLKKFDGDNVTKFLVRHTRFDPQSVLSFTDIRSEYWKFCQHQHVGKDPKSDRQFADAIQHRYPKVVSTSLPGYEDSLFQHKKVWCGLRLVA